MQQAIPSLFDTSSLTFSLELFSPRTPDRRLALQKQLKSLNSLDLLFVSITHGQHDDGSRDLLQTVRTIRSNSDHIVMPHITSRSYDRSSLRSVLDELTHLEISNLLVLRGDDPVPSKNLGHTFPFVSDLLNYLNREFTLAAACYPEGHPETATIAEELSFSQLKLEQGADFLISQLFFDNCDFINYETALKQKLSTAVCLPGIYPITNYEKARRFCLRCQARLPGWISKRFKDTRPAHWRKLGIDLAVEQCQDLIANDISHIHFYSLNDISLIKEIIDRINS